MFNSDTWLFALPNRNKPTLQPTGRTAVPEPRNEGACPSHFIRIAALSRGAKENQGPIDLTKHGDKATFAGTREPGQYSQRQSPWSEHSRAPRVWNPTLPAGDLLSPRCSALGELHGGSGRGMPCAGGMHRGERVPSQLWDGAEVMGRSEQLLQVAPAKSNR